MASWLAPWRPPPLLGLRPAAVGLVAVAVLLAAPPSAEAQGRAGGSSATPEAAADAQRHFRLAQEHYQHGAYPEAISELKQAIALDPGAKELHYNLGVVYEKVDDIDTALEHFRKYETFDLDAQEKARVEKVIRRLEGAKAQRRAPPTPTTPPPTEEPPRPAAEAPPPARGRIDGWTLGAAGLSVASLGVGIGFGLAALGARPPSTFTTGTDGSYDDLEGKLSSARSLAAVADVAFVVAGLSAVAGVTLYFARPKDPAPPAGPGSGGPRPHLALRPLGGGGTVTFGGAF